MKFVSLGFGSRLHLLDGARCRDLNLTFIQDPTDVDPVSPWRATMATGPTADWLASIYGGDCSVHPAAFSNHKPGIWYHDKFYFAGHNFEDISYFYLMNWDGSGIHKMGGYVGSNGYGAAWRNGRGTELISPSGTHSIGMQSSAFIEHNGILFIIGASPFFDTTSSTDPWRKKEGWDVKVLGNGADDGNRRKRRRYTVFGIDKRKKNGTKDHKFIASPTEFSPKATRQDDTHACDAISFGDDIYFASYCDILRFPGGSGIPQLIEKTLNIPTSKCFEIFPTSGFIDGNPVFASGTNIPDLLMLTGSGVIKQINFASGVASGTRTIFDLGLLVTDSNSGDINVRIGGSHARVTSSIAEPTRSCYLKMFNKKLHAFFPSATSGYHYARCDGDPSLLTSWINKTQELPDDFRRFDSDIYGSLDVFQNNLYLMNITKSEYGLWGLVGGQKGAGGMHLTQMSENFEFREVYRGMSAEPSVGLLPYNNVGVSVMSPSGNGPFIIASTDYVLVNYILYSAYPIICNVNIEYSIDQEMTWHKASQFRSYTSGSYVGDGKVGLTASYFGNPHTFYWAHIEDLGCNVNKKATIRVMPQVQR